MKRLILILTAFMLMMPHCEAVENTESVQEIAETAEIIQQEQEETDIEIQQEIPEDTRHIQQIAKGVELIKTNKYTEDGVQKISVLKIDLNRDNLYLKPLFSSVNTHTLETVKTLVDDNLAIAGINADFFGWGKESGTGSAIGYNVKDGELITTPCIEEEVAAVGITEDGRFVFDYFEKNIEITAADGETAPIKHINKYDDLSGIILYDRNWGKYSAGASGTIIEIVVEDNEIKEIRQEMPPALIPEDGYILTGLTDLSPFLTEHLAEGDKIKLSVEITPAHDCEHIIGGGTLLIKGGKEHANTHNIGGRNPRSAFATDKSGKTAYFIAVDGRGKGGSIGMTMNELRDFLFEMGAYNAINFDGGGSTQLVVREDAKWKSTVVNSPSQEPYRKVINALGLMDKKYIRNFSAEAYAENFDTASMTELYVYPRDIKAEYEVTEDKEGRLIYDFTEETDKLLSAGFSLSSPALITEKNAKISIDVMASEDNKQWLRYMLTDADGDVQRLTIAEEINWNGKKTLTATVPDDVKLPAKLTRIYMVQPKAEVRSAGEVYFDNLTVTGQKAFNFAVAAGVYGEDNMLGRITNVDISAEIGGYNESLVICETDRLSGSIKRKKSAITNLAGVSVLQCDSGSLPSGKINSDVIIAVSETDPRGTSLEAELKSEAGRGKKVFAVFAADKTETKKSGSVTYIGLEGFAPALKKTGTCDILNFYSENGNIKYEIMKYIIW